MNFGNSGKWEELVSIWKESTTSDASPVVEDSRPMGRDLGPKGGHLWVDWVY